MDVPKIMRTYCPKCKTHREFAVSIYKKGKDRSLAEGARRYEKKQRGYGGQKKPVQRKKAKTTKKQVLKLKCKVCGFTIQKKGVRLRKVQIK